MTAVLRTALAVCLAGSLAAGAAWAQGAAPPGGVPAPPASSGGPAGAQRPSGAWSWPPQGSVWPTQPGPQETVAPGDARTPLPAGEPAVPGVGQPPQAPAFQVPSAQVPEPPPVPAVPSQLNVSPPSR